MHIFLYFYLNYNINCVVFLYIWICKAIRLYNIIGYYGLKKKSAHSFILVFDFCYNMDKVNFVLIMSYIRWTIIPQPIPLSKKCWAISNERSTKKLTWWEDNLECQMKHKVHRKKMFKSIMCDMIFKNYSIYLGSMLQKNGSHLKKIKCRLCWYRGEVN